MFQFKYTENSQIVLFTRKNPAKHFLIITFSTEDQNCLISFEILAAIFFRRTDSSFSAFTSLLFCSWWYFKTALDICKIKQLFQWYTLQWMTAMPQINDLIDGMRKNNCAACAASFFTQFFLCSLPNHHVNDNTNLQQWIFHSLPLHNNHLYETSWTALQLFCTTWPTPDYSKTLSPIQSSILMWHFDGSSRCSFLNSLLSGWQLKLHYCSFKKRKEKHIPSYKYLSSTFSPVQSQLLTNASPLKDSPNVLCT